MEENVKQQAFREALDVNRDIYNQSVAGIDADIERLKEQRKMIKQDYKTRKKAIIREFNQPTPESIRKRRKAEAYRIQRFIGGNLLDWKSKVLNGETSRVTFELQEEQVVLTVTVPHKPYEFKSED